MLAAPCYHPPICSAGAPASNDTAPQADVAGLDLSRIKPEYGAVDASLNGPKLLMIDWAEADIDVRRQFNGIHIVWNKERRYW